MYRDKSREPREKRVMMVRHYRGAERRDFCGLKY